ncbi:MAG: DUF167 domain-containing protein [Chlamydiota bacterium]
MAPTRNTLPNAKLAVKVIPKSSKNELIGWENDALKIRLRAIPEKGQANAALITFLAELLDIAQSQITLTHGETSRLKRLIITGISQEQLTNILSSLCETNKL